MELSIRDLQRLLTASGYYAGGIDGDYGPKSIEAVHRILDRNKTLVPNEQISPTRQRVVVAQLILNAAGFEAGTIDGYFGHNTAEALNAWAYQSANGHREQIKGDDVSAGKGEWPKYNDLTGFYGPVGENQTRIELPYSMKLAWDTSTTITQMTCHQRVATPLRFIFEETLRHYGEDKVRELRLDMFGGSLNVRKMRGGSRYSVHSWGAAVDIDPINNQLRWGSDRAWLARPVYKPFWKIVESTGAISLGRSQNRDWMHFQFSDL